MPFKSEAQRKLFHVKADRGEISPEVVHEWEHATPNKAKLPEHVKKSSEQIADEVLAKLGANVAKGIGVFSAGKGGPKALERVMHREAPMQHTPATPQSQPIEWRKSIGEKPKGSSEMLKFFSLKEAAVDPEVMEAAALKSSGSGASKLWQGLTGLSDDVLMAGMNIKQKMDRTKQREKHAAEQVVSSLSMLTKMSDVAKKEKLQGGKADGKSDSEYDSHQLAMGEAVEREHSPARGLPQEQPVQATSPMSLSPDIIQLLRAQMLVDQAKMAKDEGPSALGLAAGGGLGAGLGHQIGQEVGYRTHADMALKEQVKELEDFRAKSYRRSAEGKPFHSEGLEGVSRQMAGQEINALKKPINMHRGIGTLGGALVGVGAAYGLHRLFSGNKQAQVNDSGDVRVPYQRERENEGQDAPEVEQEQAMRQAQYEHQLAEQMRAQKVEHEYTGKVRRGELAGALGGMGAGAGIGYLLGKPGSRFAPMAVGGALTGLLGKGLGRHVGQQQGLDYLKEYSGMPWEVQ